jgi:cyclic dehypoxanthinyl futalosine synthase
MMAITRKQALDLFRSDDLIGLGLEADTMRRDLHPEGVVTYSLDRSIDCGEFTAAEELSFNAIDRQIDGITATGCSAIRVKTHESQRTDIATLEHLLREINKKRSPQLSLRSFSALEILQIARDNRLSIRNVLARLRDAGLDSILGDNPDTYSC